MAVNDQYSNPPFGLQGDYTSSGAEGSQGISAAQDAPALMTVPVTPSPYWSAQLGDMPSATVSVGDTSAYSSDDPTPVNPLLPDADGASATGAGAGTVYGPRHRSAGR
jgi:hypothetical protein